MLGIVSALILIGVVLIILEILVIPGTTVVGFLGLILMGIGVYLSYTKISTTIGHYTLAASIVFFILMLVISLRPKTWKKAMLNTSIDSTVNYIGDDKNKFIDKECVTLTRLNPFGKVSFENEYYEAKSYYNIIEPNTIVVIINVEGNTLIVKPK
ncbi:MAG TPA: NfeD family protein [Bacteroidales bacterium]|nr:NfeD family protein [Bacteroidales bacterium]